jgi:hypothetical protein
MALETDPDFKVTAHMKRGSLYFYLKYFDYAAQDFFNVRIVVPYFFQVIELEQTNSKAHLFLGRVMSLNKG